MTTHGGLMLGRKAAALDLCEMPHLVEQDHHRKADTEPGSVERPVNSKKRREAEEELQLEERKQE